MLIMKQCTEEGEGSEGKRSGGTGKGGNKR